MAYSKTTWVDGQAPAISAANLNKLETQYDEAVAAFNAANAPVLKPSGGDDTAALQAAVAAGNVTLVGSFSIGQTINIPSQRTINGNRAASITWTGADAASYFFESAANFNIVISGISFNGKSNLQAAMHSTGGHHVQMVGNYATNTRLFVSRSSLGDNAPYSAVTMASRAHHIRVSGNFCQGSSKSVGFAAIELQYTDDWVVTDNFVSAYGHGIQWWGGDANFNNDGALANERKCRRGFTHGNQVRNVLGGGVWGSMGEDLSIGPDIIENCDDVGVDLEGCRNAIVYVGSVRNAKNGNLTTFFGADNVQFVGGASVQDDPTWLHYNTNNATADPSLTKSVLFRNVQFDTTTGIGRAGGASGPAELVTVLECTFRNTRLSIESDNSRHMLVNNNVFQYTRVAPSAFNVITMARSINEGDKVISNNYVTSSVNQPSGTVGIKLTESDPNTSPSIRVEGNQIIRSIGYGLDANWSGSNPGFFLAARFFITDNIWNAGRVTSTGAATPAVIVDRDNMTRFAEPLSIQTS